MTLTIPELSFVVLIGVSGSGKSTFVLKHSARMKVMRLKEPQHDY